MQDLVDESMQELAEKDEGQSKGKKKRPSLPQSELPRVTLEETVPVIQTMFDNIASGAVSFEDLARLLGSSPNTTRTKYLIWGSEAYGLIIKNEKGDYSLSETGRKIISPTYDGEDIEAKVKAILTPTILSKFYREYDKHPIPQDNYFTNMLEVRLGVPRDRIEEAKEIILNNARYSGILKTDQKSSKEIIDLEQPVPETAECDKSEISTAIETVPTNMPAIGEWDKTCFVICPIGEENSHERKHSDMLLKHMIQPVLSTYGFNVIRADKIEKTGLITQQILEHLVKSRLCIADLSFNNPNVFYELGVRHMSRLPTIQVIRKGDKIPFDVSQGRTIVIDTSDVYTLIDRIESAKKELTEYVQTVVGNVATETSDDNPIRVYLPGVKVTIPR